MARPWSLPAPSLRWRADRDSKFLFFGQTEQVAPLMAKHPALQAASRLVHADIAVRMEDKPSQALR